MKMGVLGINDERIFELSKEVERNANGTLEDAFRYIRDNEKMTIDEKIVIAGFFGYRIRGMV